MVGYVVSPADVPFPLRWHDLKRTIDAAAPALIDRFFGPAAQAHGGLITRLVTEGKSARGCLCCLVCEALGGRVDDAVPRAVLLEIVQAATLVHDDIVDGDSLRRGRAATWTVLGQRRTVLLGDLMFATALMHAARSSHADVSVLAEAIGRVAGGAWQEPMDAGELLAIGYPVPASLYEQVVHGKTGALFGAAGALGAIAAGAGDAQRTAAERFATRVGEAYQMADDCTDLLGCVEVLHDTQKSAARNALAAHFGVDRDDAAALPGATLRARLQDEIARRLRLARADVDRLAEGGAAALLHAAPAFIIGLQLPPG
ncbi:MAG: polyprenyl synthetase family protein [Casimicrobiaceae bacterium]